MRAEHREEILRGACRVDWFEAQTENYLDTGGAPLATLEHVRRDVPVALHGVALSIGSSDPLDLDYLRKLRDLVRQIEPWLVTDHLCWTGVHGRSLYDLLPLPCTEEALAHVVARVRVVQSFLGRRIALENPSTYFAWRHSTLSDAEFLSTVAEDADCGILLDVNNVYVSARNTGFDPFAYLERIPPHRVAQIHLAGFTDMGTHLFDTHGAPVHPEVWRLYARAIERFGSVSTLVEWDAEIPPFTRLAAETERAREIAESARSVHEPERNARPEAAPAAALDRFAGRAIRAA
ncbi:MAG: MNIO family bufferin maturase [Candidatus Binatia bacterium]